MKDLNFSSLFQRGLLLTGLLAAWGTAVAETGQTTINFTYQITAAPCVVQSDDVQVDLGNMFSTDFSTAGNYGGEWKPFTIKVENCPDLTEKVNVTFTGTPSTGGADKYYASTGTATNVEVELQDKNGGNLGNTKVLTQSIDAASKGTTLELQARAHAINGMTVSPGTIKSAVLATFTYE